MKLIRYFGQVSNVESCEWPRDTIRSCKKDEFCCGSECKHKSLKGLEPCPAFENCQPADDGCPKGKFCCGSTCIDDRLKLGRFKPSECAQPCDQPPYASGPCKASWSRWTYDKDLKKCKWFIYGGCLGNSNRFSSRRECEKQCVQVGWYCDSRENQCKVCKGEQCSSVETYRDRWSCSSACRKPPCAEDPFDTGPCEALIPSWSFNPATRSCESFNWGGCGGNRNRFLSKQQCERSCQAFEANNCCRPQDKCCGTGCIDKNAQTFAPCGEPQCCGKFEPCICITLFDPVCDTNSGTTFTNSNCAVQCGGVSEKNLVPGSCDELEKI